MWAILIEFDSNNFFYFLRHDKFKDSEINSHTTLLMHLAKPD